jgi:Cu/Zn superoxide dismutase
VQVNAFDRSGTIIDQGFDNFANIPLGPNTDQYTANSTAATDKTNATGNAGDRLLCGLVTTP